MNLNNQILINKQQSKRKIIKRKKYLNQHNNLNYQSNNPKVKYKNNHK